MNITFYFLDEYTKILEQKSLDLSQYFVKTCTTKKPGIVCFEIKLIVRNICERKIS